MGDKMLSVHPAAKSRMHVLNWLDGGMFIPSINELLQQTEFFVPQCGKRMPSGWNNPNEALLGKECGSLIDNNLNDTILRWWLAKPHPRANIPNWDLICEAIYQGKRPALVLAEAKAYVTEFTRESKGQGGDNPDNRNQISQAIEQAREALSQHDVGVKISADRWYQFANRVAFSWKLATHGIPTALIYVGFTGDLGAGVDYLRDHNHWRKTVIENTQEIFPRSLWEKPIDINGIPLSFLIRSLPYTRQSPA
jgi:hypothetical protein